MDLVTGGTGFLGRTLVNELVKRGKKVRVFDLEKLIELPSEVEFIKGDIRDYQVVEKACEDIDVVYHLVALMPQRKADKKTMVDVNVVGTENVLKASLEKGLKKVVFLSSSEVYGAPEKIPITEDSKLNPIGEYGKNKVEAEKLCLKYYKEKGLPVVILRPMTIVGPGIDIEPFPTILERGSKGKALFMIGDGSQRFQMVDVVDCAEACILAAEKDEATEEIFNLGSESVPSFRELAEEIKKHAQSKSRIYSVNPKLAKAFLRILDIFGLSPLEKDHYMLIEIEFVLDISKAKKILGWSPRKNNFQMAKEIFDWYIQDQRQKTED